MLERLFHNWVYGGFLSAFIFIGFGFAFLENTSLLVLLIYLHLPIYQLHQFEEHDRDRFRQYMNREIGGGLEILTPAAVFVINIFGVWILFAVLISLAYLINPGWGLGVVYGTLFNAIIHIAAALKSRSYNPGAITAVVLFLPLSLSALILALQNNQIVWADQIVGLAIGVGLHAIIIVFCAARMKRLKKISILKA